MKVYLELPTESRGLKRVYDALIRYKPDDIEVVKDEDQADLVILHVIGRHDQIEKKTYELEARNTPYIMIQYAIRSTMRPSTLEWVDMWQRARLVWSYYDLPALCIEDGLYREGVLTSFPFYHSPLGADPDVFFPRDTTGNKYVVTASSQHALAEGARECAFATKEVGGKMAFIGHELRRGPDIVCMQNVTDLQLSYIYTESEFVSGLRRIEGFELPAVEGLFCGARPILFDAPHYKHWYGNMALYIREQSREEVIDALKIAFKVGPVPVSREEIERAHKIFNWETIITNFWKKAYE